MSAIGPLAEISRCSYVIFEFPSNLCRQFTPLGAMLAELTRRVASKILHALEVDSKNYAHMGHNQYAFSCRTGSTSNTVLQPAALLLSVHTLVSLPFASCSEWRKRDSFQVSRTIPIFRRDCKLSNDRRRNLLSLLLVHAL